MNDNENKKTPEELADEALDAVTGGGRSVACGECPECNGYKEIAIYHNPADRTETLLLCADCARDLGYVL